MFGDINMLNKKAAQYTALAKAMNSREGHQKKTAMAVACKRRKK